MRNSFLPYEAMTILSIPISQNLPDDSLVWAWTKKCIFTVKSAYHVAHRWLTKGRSLGAGGEESNIVRDPAPGPFYDVGPNPREWVESYYCLSKWRFD